MQLRSQLRSQWRLRLRLTSVLKFNFDNLRVGDEVDGASFVQINPLTSGFNFNFNNLRFGDEVDAEQISSR